MAGKVVKTLGGVVGVGLNAYGAKTAYNDSRAEGHGVATSVGRAAFDFAFYEMLGGAALPYIIAKEVGGAAASYAHEKGKQNAYISNKARNQRFGGWGTLKDNQATYTMRSRGVQQLQQSKLNGYSTLGSEARSYFR